MMDIQHLVSHDLPAQSRPEAGHSYPTRHSISATSQLKDHHQSPHSPQDRQYTRSVLENHNAQQAGPPSKEVSFELLFDGAPNHKSRLPLRVMINAHDNTDSIVATIRNFYGLYQEMIAFENEQGQVMIARYENFRNNMTVYVRVVPTFTHSSPVHSQISHPAASPSGSQKMPHLEEAFQMPPPQTAYHNYSQPISRPHSRAARKQSPSPRPGLGRRSASTQKGRSRSGRQSREPSIHEDFNSDAMNGYSSSDGGAGSVTSSRKAKSELATAEISLDNIVEGGRRKRAKFESSVSNKSLSCLVYATNIR